MLTAAWALASVLVQPVTTPSRIAFGSCAHQDQPQPIWASIVNQRPDLFVWLGDNIYGDTEDRQVFLDKYAKLNAKPGYQLLKETCPVLATWDDHDYGVNDGGASYPKREMANELFDEFFDVPAEERAVPGVYFERSYGLEGQRLQIIALDTRYFRSDLVRENNIYIPQTDPSLTMLGDVQWRWLEEQLRKPADVRILVSSIQVVAEDHQWEKWANLPRERDRLFQLIKDTEAEGVIVISGDRHHGEISQMDAGLGYPLYDVTSSGLTQSSDDWRAQEVNKHRVMTMRYGDNFGLITVDWAEEDPTIRLQLRDTHGDIAAQQILQLSWLKRGRIRN